jgi:serine/threonine protein kinase/Flp pilus assembly protein TadD
MAERYPKRFGKYVLLKPLARGGMGEIYVAASGEIDGFEKLCVVKKVLTERTDRGKANRFLDEAKVVLRLSHGNLVLTFDAGEVEGEFFIAMELVEGKDLREIWNRCVRTRTRIPLDVALHVVREIARALSYVHNYGDLNLIHRDVAPPNILMSYFGQVKLTDFGLARSVLKQEHTNPGVVFGRASYLAPEQARGEAADARSDIYSLGIVLWELLTGQQYLQLSDLDPATALSLVRHPRPRPPSTKAPWIGPELDEIVMCALNPNREQRFQTAEQMRQALSEVIIRVAPHADAERASDFLRGLYGDIIKEEREERERLLRGRLDAIAGAEGVFDPAAPGTDFIGRIVDNRYRILRKIGEGGMGAIYAGEHIEIRKGVALKILHPVYSKQKNLVERFRREARAASRVGHPNIIDVTDFGTTEDGCAYFVMEHLDGIDLADVLSHERRIAPLRAVRIGIQICGALHAAHEAGVIHRDLKPENIFLVARDGEADFVKVLDFGIARSLNRRSRRLTNPGMAMGTPEYMAPEQAIGTVSGDAGGGVDRRSDIYSVGALLYEMICGLPPHPGITPQEILAQSARSLPEPLRAVRPEVPEELDRVILRALEPDPERRFQTMAQLQYELTKSVWGRPRAVAELLSMRDPSVSTETPLGLRNRWSESLGVLPAHNLGSGTTWPMLPPEDVEDRALGDGRGEASREEAGDLETSSESFSTPIWRPTSRAMSGELDLQMAAVRRSHTANDAAPSSLGRLAQFAVRTVGTLAILSLGIAASLAAYHRFSWVRGGAASFLGAPRPPAARRASSGEPELRAGRLRAIEQQAQAKIAAGLTPATVPALESLLMQARREGGFRDAERLSRSASEALRRQAEAALNAGDLERGVTLFKLAVRLSPTDNGNSLVVHARGAPARGAGPGRRPREAERWGRKAAALGDADPQAHGLLAGALYATGDFAGASAEYGRALAAHPDDQALKRGLALARAHLGRPAPRMTPRPRAAATAAGAARAPDAPVANQAIDEAAPAPAPAEAPPAPAEPERTQAAPPAGAAHEPRVEP